jgi:hypothetical protein
MNEMAIQGHTYHFSEPPEFYLVDENVHVVDRIKGEVTLHKIYPPSVLERLGERARHVKNAAEMMANLARPPKVKKARKASKSKKRK